MTSIFMKDKDVLEVKGDIPYWIIANQLGIHENTLRNWLRRGMDPVQKKRVLDAIKVVKKEMIQAI